LQARLKNGILQDMSAEAIRDHFLDVVKHIDYSSRRVQAIAAILLGTSLGPITVWSLIEIQKEALASERNQNYSYQNPLPTPTSVETYIDPRIDGRNNPSFSTAPFNKQR
jgi:hypothetical protein